MSLIKCTECNQDVSSEAPICPHCGIEINKFVVTIESTSKDLKALILLSIFCVLIGSYFLYSNFKDKQSSEFLFGASVASCGALLYIITKISIWWNHK